MPKDVGLRIKALHWNRHECVTTTRHQGQEDRQTQWFCDFSLDRHHLGFSTVEVFYESPGLFCFQSELATVSQTRRWDKTKLRREPGTLFECMWTVCLCTAQFVCVSVYIHRAAQKKNGYVFTFLFPPLHLLSPWFSLQTLYRVAHVTHSNATADMCCLEIMSHATLK